MMVAILNERFGLLEVIAGFVTGRSVSTSALKLLCARDATESALPIEKSTDFQRQVELGNTPSKVDIFVRKVGMSMSNLNSSFGSGQIDARVASSGYSHTTRGIESSASKFISGSFT